jgi:hypothetical protein
MRSAIYLAVLLTVHAACLAAVPQVEAVRLADPVVVDGDLSEPSWAQGQWYTNFAVLDRPDVPAQVQTRFKVRFDDANLYIGAQMDEPNIGELKASITERDGKVYSDDCVEVMVDPTGERTEYYHFIVNSKGVVYDSQSRQAGAVQTREWDCAVRAAAKVGASSWSVELAIPFVELGLTRASTGQWAINVARERQAGRPELSTFSPMTGGFHQPSLYAALTLPGADLGRLLWEIKPPYEVLVYPGTDGKLLWRAKTHVTNAGPKFAFFLLRAKVGEGVGEWVKGGLDSGQSAEFALTAPVAATGRQTMALEIVDRADPNLRLALRSTPTEIQYTPLSVTLIKPWYRDSIYATETVNALVFDVALALPPGELEGLTLACSLMPGKPGEPATGVSPGSWSGPAKAQMRVTMALKWPAEPAYDYTLDVALVGADGKAVHETQKRIRKLPKVADEWRLDEHNVLLHNGEPVLPFGWFSMDVADMGKPEHAYTLCQAYNLQYLSIPDARAMLEKYAAAGTAVTSYPYPGSGMMENAAWGRPLSDAEAEALRQRVAALKDCPGLWAWYMADEPELRPALPERTRRIYEVIAEEDPYHPCIMLNDTLEGIRRFKDGGDILMPDPYPCFIKGGLAAQPLQKTSVFIKTCAEAGQGRRGIMVTPQAFNYGDYGKLNQRGPNLTELRNQMVQAIIYGAKGFLWYTYAHAANYPEIGIGMPWLSFEAQNLKPAILADPAADIQVRVEAANPEHVHVSARRVGNDIYLFAANTDTAAQDVKLTLTGAALGKLFVVSEGRSVEVSGGVLQDRFDVYATHIYTTNQAVAEKLSLAAPRAAIGKAEAARRKPGNLAFEDNGTTVEVSSKAQYGSTPDRLVDGIIDGMKWTDRTARELPDWATIHWPQAARVGRVVVYSPTAAALEVQVPEGDGWRTVGRSSAPEGTRLEAVLDEVVTTSAVRVLVTKLLPDQIYTTVWEVEAYEK